MSWACGPLIPGANSFVSVRIEPAPANTRVNVPTNSARPRRSGSYSIAGKNYGADRTARVSRLGGFWRSAPVLRAKCLVQLGEDGERGAEAREIQDLVHLCVVAFRQDERKADPGLFCPLAGAEQDAQRRRVDEGRSAKVDDD